MRSGIADELVEFREGPALAQQMGRWTYASNG